MSLWLWLLWVSSLCSRRKKWLTRCRFLNNNGFFLTHMSWTGHISQWFYKVCRLYRSLLDRHITTVIGGQCVAKKTPQVPFACTARYSCLDSITIYSMVVRDILLFNLLPMIAHAMCHTTCISLPFVLQLKIWSSVLFLLVGRLNEGREGSKPPSPSVDFDHPPKRSEEGKKHQFCRFRILGCSFQIFV